MKDRKKIKITECYFINETTGNLCKRREVRKALRRDQKVNAIMITGECKRVRTSPIVSISKNSIETEHTIYVFD